MSGGKTMFFIQIRAHLKIDEISKNLLKLYITYINPETGERENQYIGKFLSKKDYLDYFDLKPEEFLYIFPKLTKLSSKNWSKLNFKENWVVLDDEAYMEENMTRRAIINS
jgi:hypothetical protein